jgi:hypothetical protein
VSLSSKEGHVCWIHLAFIQISSSPMSRTVRFSIVCWGTVTLCHAYWKAR